MEKRDYYDILEVSKNASFSEIKTAFRNKAKKYHPDLNPGDKEAELRFKEINEAYEVLSDEQKRSAYDQFGHNAFSGSGMGGGFSGGFEGFSDIFENIFSNFMGGDTRASRSSRGSDIRYDLEISLSEAYTGTVKNISIKTYVRCESCHGIGGEKTETCPHCSGTGRIRRQQGFFMTQTPCPYCQGTGQIIKNPCSVCHGRGQVLRDKKLEITIPAGIDHGQKMRLAGEGEAGSYGGENGDLYVFISLKKHKVFTRRGSDLLMTLPISVSMAILGDKIKIKTFSEREETLTIPEGCQNGQILKIENAGMPILRSKQFGDLFVEITVEIPTKINSKQKELIKEFASLSNEGDFLDKIKSLFS